MKVIINFYWFLWILFQHKDDECIILSKEEQEARQKICNHCPLLSNKGILAKLKGPRCSSCGCFIEYKKRYSFEVCPDTPPRWKEIKKD